MLTRPPLLRPVASAFGFRTGGGVRGLTRRRGESGRGYARFAARCDWPFQQAGSSGPRPPSLRGPVAHEERITPTAALVLMVQRPQTAFEPKRSARVFF